MTPAKFKNKTQRMPPSYDPTTVLSRKQQSESKRAHKIKLKKQLDKALKSDFTLDTSYTTGIIPTTDFPSKRREKALKPAKLMENITNTNTTPNVSKPNPINEALRQKEIRQREKEEKIIERQKQEQERQIQREKSLLERQRIKKKLKSQSKTGQPKLSNHIDVLLGKIVKNTPGAENYMSKHKKMLRKEKKMEKKKQFTKLL